MHCRPLPDASSNLSVVGQGLESENREGEYFYCDVFQLDQVPEQASCTSVPKGKATCTEP